jgi:hypothetical protein
MAHELGELDTWDFEVAGMLYGLGYLTLPEELIDKALNPSSDLTPHEKMVLEDVPLISSKMINHIPRLENIAEMVRLSNKMDRICHNDARERHRVVLGADMLKIALQFDKVLESGHNHKSSIGLLQTNDNLNQGLVEKLANFKFGDEDSIRTVNVENLMPGMVLLEDMITDNNSTLLSKGTELSEELLVRIRLYTQNQKVSRPIQITASQ